MTTATTGAALTTASAVRSGIPTWAGPTPVATDAAGMARALRQLDETVWAVRDQQGRLGLAVGGGLVEDRNEAGGPAVLAVVAPLPVSRLGEPSFRADHGVAAAYMAGAMANGIASEEMVVQLARAGLLASFGCAGLLPDRIERGLDRLAREIPGLPFACNLIHSPSEQALEHAAVEVFLRMGVRQVEASAFMDLTPHIVRYRVAGLARAADGSVEARHQVIAKVSRPEVAEKFLSPAPEAILRALVADGSVTAEQAELARGVPVAQDVTAEADSGGHTDNRPLPALLPTILAVRDQAQRRCAVRLRIGAAGGLGTPGAIAAAFVLGADYVVTGSVNQACLESGASSATKALLAGAGIADFAMAPAADMFELGVELQVLKRGTMFAQRARKLYELYRTHDGLEDIPAEVRDSLERTVFRRPLEQVWQDTVDYFSRRDPAQIERAGQDPKRRMALVFRWYLGMASRWSNVGDPERVQDYQVWSGPAMGAFNTWVTNSYLADPANRSVDDVAHHLLTGAALASRVQQLRWAGVHLDPAVTDYRPEPRRAVQNRPEVRR